MSARLSKERALALQLLPQEVVFGVVLAGTSGAAILAHVFGPAPMAFTVPFVVMPTMVILISVMLLRRRLYQRLHVVASLLMLGAGSGLAATLVYDIVRPLLQLIFRFSFNPYQAMPIFGQLITDLPVTHPIAITAGWIYHFWNGTSFGMMFALFRPPGGAGVGLIWGLGLQCLMLVTYPRLLQVRLEDPGFLVMSLVGHGLWGIVLGLCVQKWSHDA